MTNALGQTLVNDGDVSYLTNTTWTGWTNAAVGIKMIAGGIHTNATVSGPSYATQQDLAALRVELRNSQIALKIVESEVLIFWLIIAFMLIKTRRKG